MTEPASLLRCVPATDAFPGERTGAPELYASAGMQPVEIIDLDRRRLLPGEPP